MTKWIPTMILCRALSMAARSVRFVGRPLRGPRRSLLPREQALPGDPRARPHALPACPVLSVGTVRDGARGTRKSDNEKGRLLS
jgi:hypothetical protein